MKYIFGTSSKWRQKFFDQFDFDYEIMSADIDEKAIRFSNPQSLSLAIAIAKADKLLEFITEPTILITFDQVVVCNESIYEKPKDADELRSFWKSYENYPAQTVSAVAVTNSLTRRQLAAVDRTSTFFRPLPSAVLEQVLMNKDMYTAAGGFINHPLINPYIFKFEGTIDSVEGIPLELTKRLIADII